MASRILFLRVAWMNHYQGSRNDIPIGAGWWVAENKDGGEVANFYSIQNNLYGYAEIQNNRSLRIERLGAEKADEKVEDVTVVFFSRNPVTGSQFITGWYKHATLFRRRQQLKGNNRLGHPNYFCTTSLDDARLVPTSERTFSVPLDGPGQTNAWYVEEYHDKSYLPAVRAYLEGKTAQRKRSKGKWRTDFETRKKVEYAAMDAIAEYFEDRGFEISYVHTLNVGWDMEAKSEKQTLKLEVKGLSGAFDFVELTPNEYAKSKSDSVSYRICVVSNALIADKIKVGIFAYNNDAGNWINELGESLKVKEIIAARFYN